MKIHIQISDTLIKEKRLIFQMSERAPKASDTMQGKESKSEAVQLSEVAPQTPSEIYSDAVSAGGGMAAQFKGGMTILANLANTDPLAPTYGSGGGATTTSTTTGTTTTAAANSAGNTSAPTTVSK